MDPECISLKEYLGPIWDEWEQREIHKWKRTSANTMWLPCNWKIVLDNFNESYHVPTVHMRATPDTDRTKIRGTIDTNFKETKFDLSDEGHNRMIMKGGFGVGHEDAEGNLIDPLASLLRYWDLNPDDYKDRLEDTRPALQDAKRSLGPDRGYTHYANVPKEQLTDAFHYTLFPNFAVSVWADGFHFLRARPHRSDPEQCLFDNWWYASPASLNEDASLNRSRQAVTTSTDADEAEVTMLQYGEDSIGPAIEEDVAVFVTQQRGFRSRGFTGVYLSNQETRIRRYHEMIDEYIEKHVGPVQQG
jgi:phenylpropionate dioxygenase-like ring-hydroxylating dioxygenase large terminal subunit